LGESAGPFAHGRFFQEPSFLTHAAADVVGAGISARSLDAFR
jgi:hypothetical protein